MDDGTTVYGNQNQGYFSDQYTDGVTLVISNVGHYFDSPYDSDDGYHDVFNSDNDAMYVNHAGRLTYWIKLTGETEEKMFDGEPIDSYRFERLNDKPVLVTEKDGKVRKYHLELEIRSEEDYEDIESILYEVDEFEFGEEIVE